MKRQHIEYLIGNGGRSEQSGDVGVAINTADFEFRFSDVRLICLYAKKSVRTKSNVRTKSAVNSVRAAQFCRQQQQEMSFCSLTGLFCTSPAAVDGRLGPTPLARTCKIGIHLFFA